MSTVTLKSADAGLRSVVIRQLEWDPEVDASGIGVTAHDGAVTLTEFIDTYHGKLAAERAAKRVAGVRAVANDLQVRLRLDRTDADIAADVARALELRSTVPAKVQAVVHGGHVTLTGPVAWFYQRNEAEKAVRHIRGVRSVVNYIEVATTATAKDVKRLITAALHRSADVDARRITVHTEGSRAVLRGVVGSWAEYAAAERAAYQAPGITAVENRIEIVPPPVEVVDEVC